MINEEARKIIEDEEYVEPETVRQLDPNASSLEVQQEMLKKVIKNTDAVFIDMYVFENAVHLLNDVEAATDHVEGATPEMLWFALDKISEIRPKFKLSHEVQQYIKYIYDDAGFLFYPPKSGLKNEFLEEVKTKAKNVEDFDETDPVDQQAIKYLRILQYIENNK